MSVSAIITNISRGSLHDGPGVRSVVYLKGCGLRCRWCHNPETLAAQREAAFMPSKCIGCGRCIDVCPTHHVVRDGTLRFDRHGCTACGKCADACPAEAMSIIGERMSVQQVFNILRKDIPYYRQSGGGVTFSGGECLLHPEFVADVATLCREASIHTLVETALFVPWDNVERVLPRIDQFYVDLKLADPEKHRFYTGQDNARILENLRRLSQLSTPITVRIPVIPTVNDTAADFDGFAAILRTLGTAVREVELLKYNPLASSKYELVGANYTAFATDAQSNEQMQALCDRLAAQISLPCTFRA